MRSALARRFGASVAEVAHQDLWQRAARSRLRSWLRPPINVCREDEPLSTGNPRYLDERRLYRRGVTVDRRLLSFSDLES